MPTYGNLRWKGVYPGMNLVFGQTGAGMGVTVEADSDAALTALRLRIEGADGVRVDASGRLIADTAIGPVALPPLLARDGTPLRPEVTADGISFAAYPFNPFPQSVDSPTRPTDDPTDLLYSTYLGGSDFENPYGTALGPDNSVYLTGGTYFNDFSTTPGAYDPSYNGNGDAFISRLSPDLVPLYVLSIVPRSQPIGGRYRVGATIAIQDTNGTPVVGAAVLLDVTQPDGSTTTALRTTNSQGRAPSPSG